MDISVFVSGSGEDLTIVGLSWIERDVELKIDLKELASTLSGKTIKVLQTNQTDNFVKIADIEIKGDHIIVPIPYRSIFTITTL